VAGTWKDLTDNVNQLAGNLTVQLRDVSGVATAIARGDLTRKITVDVRGEILQIKDVINTMVDQLNGFAGEVTRVRARWAPRDGSAGRPRSRARPACGATSRTTSTRWPATSRARSATSRT
jgi:HAMP domain-containing protein